MTNLKCPCKYRGIDSDTARMLVILGKRRFAALQKAFSGRRVWIPKYGSRIPCGICANRNRCIQAWRDLGLPVAAISRFLKVSPKTVYRVLEAQRTPRRCTE